MITTPQFMTVKEAAKQIGVSRSTVYKMDRYSGPIRFEMRGKRVLIETGSLDAYLRGRSLADEQCATVPNAVTTSETVCSVDGKPAVRSGQRELTMPEWRPRVVFLAY